MMVAWLFDYVFKRCRLLSATLGRFNLSPQQLMEAAETTLARDHLATLGELSKGLFHDLASPLSSITLVAEYICTYADSDPKGVIDCARTLKNSCRDLGSLVQTIREYLANPKTVQKFSLREQANRASTLLAHRARRAGNIEIVVVGEEPTEIFARPLPVLQVMINLIANAIDACAMRSKDFDESDKYHGRVLVSVSTINGSAKIKVSDNGIGMSKEVSNHIFEPHFSTKDRSSGTGIGLASVKMIIEEILKGKISLKTAPEEGAIFYIEFPSLGFRSGNSCQDTLE